MCNSFKVNPSVLVSVSFASSSLLHIFTVLFSFILKTVSFNSQLGCRNIEIHNQDHQDTGNSSYFH